MKSIKPACFIIFYLVAAHIANGQKNARTIPEKCGTMQNLQLQWQANPGMQQQFEQERSRFNTAVRAGNYRLSTGASAQNSNRTYITIPVIFHIVQTNPALVTDAQIMAQMDTLNRDYAGLNGDSTRIPAYFKPLFGRSGIQFCLARQSPEGEPTTGIQRVTTSKTSFLNTDNGVKHASTGGADAWDPNSYLNIWVCHLSNGILGYATFPGALPDNEQGVVVESNSLPGGSLTVYNGGKTLTHESGHYFNLYHIWGDDNGACTGTDDVDDTPNQGTSSGVCSTGIVTDNCTPTGNGIMYQNYMDYTYDNCLVMFTTQQAARMESALVAYRPSLLNSIACQPAVSYNLDAQLKAVSQPAQRVCTNPFSPIITIGNRGTQTLSSVTVTTLLDNAVISTTTYNRPLAQLASANDTLAPVTATAGNHVLKIFLSAPNNGADQNTVNDTLTINFQYNVPVAAVTESFEGSLFPPTGWDVVNPDKSFTWQKASAVAKTGSASVMIDNFDYSSVGQQDYLRLPDVSLPKGLDSAFFSFQVAAAVYTDTSVANNVWDTLEVLVSRDCGQTYSSLYKKYSSTLITHKAPLQSFYRPSASEWRKDSINISSYIDAGTILLAFRNTTGNENNIYLDDINLRTVTINPFLKAKKFLVTPVPTTGPVIVQFYPQPTNVRSIQVFNMSGQKVAETLPNGQSNYYALDISRYASGAYVVRVVMGNDVLVRKIIKY